MRQYSQIHFVIWIPIVFVCMSFVTQCSRYNTMAYLPIINEDSLFVSKSSNETYTYEQAIQMYEKMSMYPNSIGKLIEWGSTDAGKPLHVFIINSDLEFDPTKFSADKTVLFINNGIHPGEPCGVDASIDFASNIIVNPSEYESQLKNVIVCIIPIYNVGGALNRNCCSRANQNGPEMYGFRGNAKNLDLNRDFIKCDSKNAMSFTNLFSTVRPNVFIDTHTSNGADYQYVMTMINTQPDKASEELGSYIRTKMTPALYQSMEERGYGMTPYVYSMNKIPDNGIKDFLETPRYSTGYAALFNCIGFTSETHMLKPFPQRVKSTLQFIETTFNFMSENAGELIDLKRKADNKVKQQKVFPLNWKLDTTQFREIPFKGFEATYIQSEVTGKDRLKYDHDQPYTKNIRYYDTYETTKEAVAPKYYVIPQAWEEVIERLRNNNVELKEVSNSTTIEAKVYYVDSVKSNSRPYEGHFMHRSYVLREFVQEVQLYPGDYVVEVNQTCNRLIVETLEPNGVDAYFVWNFFDSILQQKEWYSAYVFEDSASKMLKDFPELKEEFERQKEQNPSFADDPQSQLYWLYVRSPFYEKTVNMYPVFKAEEIPGL